MNRLKRSILSFIKKDCIVEFGAEKGTKIYDDTSVILTELLETTDFRNSKAVEKHSRYFILPEIAFYRAMQKNGIKKKRHICFSMMNYKKQRKKQVE